MSKSPDRIKPAQWKRLVEHARLGHDLAWCARGAGVSLDMLQAALLDHEHEPSTQCRRFWAACTEHRTELLEAVEGRQRIDLLKLQQAEADGWQLTSAVDESLQRWSAYADHQEGHPRETPTQLRVRRLINQAQEAQ